MAQALGTQFGIRIETSEQLIVLVKRGRVALTVSGHAAGEIVVESGQQASVSFKSNRARPHVRQLTKKELQEAFNGPGTTVLGGVPLREVVARFKHSECHANCHRQPCYRRAASRWRHESSQA